MDIAMARILAKGLFDDETKVEFVRQDPAAAHPQHRHRQGRHRHPVHDGDGRAGAQLVDFTRPYYVEGVALLTSPAARGKNFDELCRPAARNTRVSILQNVDAEQLGARGAAAGAGACRSTPRPT